MKTDLNATQNDVTKQEKRKSRTYYKVKENLEISALALPGFILLLIFAYWPMYGVIIAFKNFNPSLGIGGSPWVGFDNFKFFFGSQDAGRLLRNTLGYNIAWIILGIICAVGLAILFYNLRSVKALKIYNTIVILPRFMSTVLIAYVAYIFLAHKQGVLNQLLTGLGQETIRWYNEPEYWPFILTIVHIWSVVGMDSIIYYAALVGIDTELLEAASLDGATSWQKVRYVMIPHIVPTIIILTILAMGNIIGGDFGMFYQVTKDNGMLYPTTDIIGTYVYRALQDGAMQKSAAVGLFQSTVGFIMVIVTNLIVKKISPEDSLF